MHMDWVFVCPRLSCRHGPGVAMSQGNCMSMALYSSLSSDALVCHRWRALIIRSIALHPLQITMRPMVSRQVQPLLHEMRCRNSAISTKPSTLPRTPITILLCHLWIKKGNTESSLLAAPQGVLGITPNDPKTTCLILRHVGIECAYPYVSPGAYA